MLPFLVESTHDGETKVQSVDSLQMADWDSLVMEHPDSSFFHGVAWAKVLNTAFGFVPRYWIARTGNRVTGLLPLMDVRSWLSGARGVCLPFTDHCEPLVFDHQSGVNLMEGVLASADSRRWRYVEWRGGDGVLEGSVPSVRFYSHCLDLSFGLEKLFSGFDSAVRRAIRKAETTGITIRVTDTIDAVGRFYSLHCATRRRHGVPPQPFSFFRAVHRHILSQGMGFVVEAFCRQLPIAAAIFFKFGKKAIYKYGASDTASLRFRANNLVMWEAIRRLAADGYQSLHFGRTSLLNEGLRRFKLGWGCQESHLDYFRFDTNRRRFVAEKDAAHGWHNVLFRFMPIWLSRAVGGMLYRHVA